MQNFSFTDYSFIFDLAQARFVAMPISGDSPVVIDFETNPIGISMPVYQESLICNPEGPIPSETRQYIQPLPALMSTLVLNTRPDPLNPAVFQRLISSGGLGVTDLMDTDPLELQFLNFDFNQTYESGGLVYRLSSVWIQKGELVSTETSYTLNGESQSFNQMLEGAMLEFKCYFDIVPGG